MTKVPQAGYVKTRLKPFLSDDQCAELSRRFLADTVAKAFRITSNVIVAYSGIGDEGLILDLLPESTTCIRQKGKDLGERMLSAIDFAGSNGCGPIIVIGTDSPTMSRELMETALRRLAEPATELVLGETEDGGYYLVGLKQNIPAIFRGIPWSSDKVYSTTLERAAQAGLTGIVELPKWYDVDTPADLWRLFAELNDDSRSRAASPETSRWIDANRHMFDQTSHLLPVLSGDTIARVEMD